MSRAPLTVEALWSIPRVGEPAPLDARRAVVPVTTYDMAANEGRTRLYVVEDGAAWPLTAPDASAEQPAASPAGNRVAFLRKPGGGGAYPDKPQLYVQRLAGGEAERLTDLPFGASAPAWLPDGRRLVLLSQVHADHPTLEATAAWAKESEGAVKVRMTEDRVYRYWDHWLTDGLFHHVFVLDTDTGALTDLLPESRRWFGPMELSDKLDIAPDGTQVAFEACRSRPPYDPLYFGAFVVDVPGQGSAPEPPRALAPGHEAGTYRPRYSPDGRWIVFGLQVDNDFYADKVRLVAHDRATARETVLTEDWHLSAEGWSFLADNRLVFAAEVAARRSWFTLDVAAAVNSGAAPEAVARGGWLGDPRPAGGRVYAVRQSLGGPPEIVAGQVADPGEEWELSRVTTFTAAAMEGVELGEVREVTFPGTDDRAVQMFLVDPPGAAAEEALPLVHMIHGGPHGVFGDQFHWRWNPHLFAAPGYRVALVNFHGSTGWGAEFTASILGRWGDQPATDILAATDWLVDHGLADPSRMAITGGSYGGYLVAWLCSQTQRFACAIDHAGVNDFQVQFATDVTQGRERSMGGAPWGDQEGLDRYNPMRHAAGFATPMLILHGMRDFRVPYANGLALYSVLQARGVPARLVIYDEENHWILKPRSSRHWYGEVRAWLARWLAAPAAPPAEEAPAGASPEPVAP